MTLEQLAIMGVVFAVVCSIVKAQWGYSKYEVYRDSPLGLLFDKWVANPIRFFLLFCVFAIIVHVIKASWPAMMANISQLSNP